MEKRNVLPRRCSPVPGILLTRKRQTEINFNELFSTEITVFFTKDTY